jgi:hypothetical protein
MLEMIVLQKIMSLFWKKMNGTLINEMLIKIVSWVVKIIATMEVH